MIPSQPIIQVHGMPDGTVIENLDFEAPTPGAAYAIYVGGGTKNLTIRNCRFNRFCDAVALVGSNPGFTFTGNTVCNCQPPAPAPGKSVVRAIALYTEGMDGAVIDGNLWFNNGWWPTYDFTNATDRDIAAQNHDLYDNESGGTTDNVTFTNNLSIDSAGSGLLMRKGGNVTGNVFRGSFDWSVIAASMGGKISVRQNGFFGPKSDALPNYGGGIHFLGTGPCDTNYFAGSAAITNNACAQDGTGKVLPQLGYWPKPGATQVAIGSPVPTLEAFYGTKDIYSAMKPGDAQRIIAWLAAIFDPPKPPPQPPVQVILGSGQMGDGRGFKMVAV